MPITEPFFLGQVVLQPTSVCNLNCSYCYLPDRQEPNRMNPVITRRLASDLADMNLDYAVPLIWHGGEPLMIGRERFEQLLQPLEPLRVSKKIIHGVQTNATRIDSAWCEIFKRYDFEVGVSVDGPAVFNRNRLDWRGRDVFDKIMRGVRCLTDANIPFTCIAVVTNETLDHASELYDFFSELGCVSVSFNPEERIGTNLGSADDDRKVSRFWRELLVTWNGNPKLSIREFRQIFRWIASVTGKADPIPDKIDIFPTIGWNGDVVLLSPELLSAKSGDYQNFIAGNIQYEGLQEILERSHGLSYVREYMEGLGLCRETCKFFNYCRGGQVANKFFEHGLIAVTETRHCRNSQQKPLETVLEFLEH